MAYSELVKNFERIRSYMREFYVFGFKRRGEYDAKSARSYDNERRRMESWLGDYISFHKDASGKNVFLSLDSRRIPRNPLYKAFKAKSFTRRDLTLHFYIMDLLAEGESLTSKEIVERIGRDYLAHFENAELPDESTVRKKLKEYEALGLLRSDKQDRKVTYRRTDDGAPDLASWGEALAFFSEADPLGVAGSYLEDKLEAPSEAFRFKHHYILHALDSEILYQLLRAIEERRTVDLTAKSLKKGQEYRRSVCPLKIYVSTQSGRQYLLGYYYAGRRMSFYRLDSIKKIEIGNIEKHYDKYLCFQSRFDKNLWGVSAGADRGLDHIEMTIRFGPEEDFILRRLEREKRHGSLEVLDEHTCRFTADVYDAAEMLPWLRTFIGRIVELKCSSGFVTKAFYEDLAQMNAMYGGDADAV